MYNSFCNSLYYIQIVFKIRTNNFDFIVFSQVRLGLFVYKFLLCTRVSQFLSSNIQDSAPSTEQCERGQIPGDI